MPTNLDYVRVLRSQVGKRYCNEGPWRCTMQFECADCSGFDCWGLNELGIAYPCSNTDLMAYDLRRKGLLVSAAYARATPGCWAIRLSGSHHMVTTDFVPGKVVEAASHALGIRIGNFDGRGFGVFGKPPGLVFPGGGGGGPIGAYDSDEELHMIVQPKASKVDGRLCVARLNVAAGCVELLNGAAIAYDEPVAGDPLMRRWFIGRDAHHKPPFKPGGHPIGVAEVRDGLGRSVGVCVTMSDKGTFVGRWS